MAEAQSENATPRKLKFEQLRADYDLFLQTFEKPTWIYRLMQRRHQLSPYMLYRNLSYQHKTKKPRTSRKKFKIDDMLSKLDDTKKVNGIEDEESEEKNLHITFAGFFHGPGFAEELFLSSEPKSQELFKDEFVKVEINLCTISFKKKKGEDDPVHTTSLGTCKAPWNPCSQLLLPCSSVNLKVPATAMTDNGKAIKAQILSITVSIVVPKPRKKSRVKKEEPIQEPVSKRLRLDSNSANDNNKKIATTTLTNGNATAVEDDTTLASFSAELFLYDRHRNCLLTDGEYELLLHGIPTNNGEARHNGGCESSWENKFRNKLGPFAAFSFGPTIKFNLNWTTKPFHTQPAYKTLAEPYLKQGQPLAEPYTKQGQPLAAKSLLPNGTTKENGHHKERMFYQFVYNNKTRQQTEAKEGFECPWCAVECHRLYPLLKHLQCCHPRFSFKYTPVKKGHKLETQINSELEPSLNTTTDMGFVDIETAPIKRTPQTRWLVVRPHKNKEDMREFTHPPSETSSANFTHTRSYYSTTNNQLLPSLASHDISTEDIHAPNWLKEKTQAMIEEFSDVNVGEKQLMKMWNIHMLEKGYISDTSCAEGCITFAREHGATIVEKGLVTNFLLHLNNLFDFQVISQTFLFKSIQIVYDMKAHVETTEN